MNQNKEIINEEVRITNEQERIANELLQQIQKYVGDDEEIFLKNLITEFALLKVEQETTENIFKKIYREITTITRKKYEWEDYENWMDDLYIEEKYENGGLQGLHHHLKKKISESEAQTCINEIKIIISPFENKETYSFKISNEKYILLNKPEKVIQSKTIHTKNSGEITSLAIEKIINAYPEEIIIHDSPLTDMGRTFSIKWTSKTSSRLFETKQATITEIANYLKEAGWVIQTKELKGVLSAIISTSITNKLATIRTDIENPGFYWDTTKNKIIKVETDLPQYENNLGKSFKVLEDLEKYSSIEKQKLASVIKWALVSPFNYAKKQRGNSWIPWLYLHGKARSGKTTMGLISLYIWGKPDQNNNIGGSGFDTVARVGEKLGISTLPLLVNEPEGALKKPSVMGLIKSAIESPTARGKFMGGKYHNLPSFAPVILTANVYLPEQDSVLRRMYSIRFSHNEKKDEEESKKFEAKFQINNTNKSPLNNLHYLSSFVFEEIRAEPSLLELDWKELADTLLIRAYAEEGKKRPKWLQGWYESESLEELDEDETEEIRMFLFEEINKNAKQIKVYKESGFQEQDIPLEAGEYDDEDKFRNRVWDVLANKLISWAGVRTTKDNTDQVYFKSGMKRDIKKVTKTCTDLKSISELLGWEYKAFKLGKKNQKGMVVDFDEFVEFLSPNWEE